jgi:hypothetical protein
MKNTRLFVAIALLLCLATALQAATFVQAEQNAAQTVSSISVAFDSNVTSGQTLFVDAAACGTSGIANDFGITDTLSSSYTEVTNGSVPLSGCSSGFGSTLFYAPATASGPNTVTAINFPSSPITGDLDLVIMAVAGGTGGLDQSELFGTMCTSSCASPFSGPTVTTTSTETLIATIYDKHTAHGWTISSPWVICPSIGGNPKCVTNNPGAETLAMAYYLNAPAGTYTPQWSYTGTTSTGIIAITASFFPNTATAVRHKAVVY